MTRELRILCISLLLWGMGEGMFYYLQPLYLRELGANPIQIGAFLGVAGIAITLSHIPAGALSDAVGRKQVMVAAWLAGMLAAWIMFAAGGLAIFVTGMVLYSFSGFVLAPMSSYISAARGRWSLARALTVVFAMFNVGVLLGPMLGGQLAERFGLRVIYGSAAVLFSISTVLVLLLRRQPTEQAPQGSRYRRVLTNPALRRFLPLVFIAMFAMYLSWPLTPNFLQEERMLSVGTIGLLGSFNALGVVLLNLILGRLQARSGFLFAQVAVAGSALLLWQAGAVPWYALAYFLAGGTRTARSLVTAQVDNLVSRTDMGLAYGLAETVSASVLMLASPTAGLLYDRQAWLPYPVSLLLIALATVLFFLFQPESRSQSCVDPKAR